MRDEMDNLQRQKELEAQKKKKSLIIMSFFQFLFIVINLVVLLVPTLALAAIALAVVYIFLLVNFMKGKHYIKEAGYKSTYANVVSIISPILYFASLLLVLFAGF